MDGQQQHEVTCNCEVCLRMWEGVYREVKSQAAKREEMASVVPWWRWKKKKVKVKR